jgi:FKBP-type peptidyl-prolyl cis-trans isomerase SlyD
MSENFNHRTRGQVISFHCVMKDKLGRVLSTSFNQDVINQTDQKSSRLSGLVDGLQAVQAGEKRSIFIPETGAYGSHNPALVVELRRSELEYGEHLRLGSQVLRMDRHSTQERIYRVIRIDEENVLMDGNHPLAGHDLVCEVEIIAARDVQESDFGEAALQISHHLVH